MLNYSISHVRKIKVLPSITKLVERKYFFTGISKQSVCGLYHSNHSMCIFFVSSCISFVWEAPAHCSLPKQLYARIYICLRSHYSFCASFILFHTWNRFSSSNLEMLTVLRETAALWPAGTISCWA